MGTDLPAGGLPMYSVKVYNMPQIVILTRAFLYNPQTNRISIGGLETYLCELARTCQKNGFEVVICQKFTENFTVKFEEIQIEGVCCLTSSQKFYRKVRAKYGEDAFYIIDSDQEDIRTKAPNVVVIQHGIAFDGPGDIHFRGRYCGIGKCFLKLLKVIWNIRRFHRVRNMVCVDYNYFNWIRAVTSLNPKGNIRVIPNYTSSIISQTELEKKLKEKNRKRIVFARRFTDYRGTLLFAEVVDKLLLSYPDLQFTFAGDGPFRNFLEEKYKQVKQVCITSYDANESVAFHYQYGLAVVPTLFSEGTSLALCEAMAAGCYPIATHVGGMTNMIIDGYNGSLVYPSVDAVYKQMEEVLLLPDEEFERRVERAWETAKYGFSLDKWRASWMECLQYLMER